MALIQTSIRTAILLACVFGCELGANPEAVRADTVALAVGDIAPQFELQGSDGKLYRLVDLLAEGGVDGIVLAWFPKAFTHG